MKKKNKKVMMVMTGALIAFSANAFTSDPYQLSHECEAIAHKLQNLAHTKPDDSCSGDLQIASSYMKVAGSKLQHGKYAQASTSIHYADFELQAISYRPYCAHVANQVKFIRAEVISLANQVDDFYGLKSQVDQKK
ncbi:hypothetical protein [Legionella sp.]|uniref:hypothetical protein n=1 Tax=Legionella sp. TaxID=459 RepID=UPI000CB4F131|nr:hypothetical protein [Legionella sp.]PJE09573.1 MAG: hypothetical protein CK430_11025 [Legionella sp.]